MLADEGLRIQLGTALLYVFSVVTGRVMSDMTATRVRLREQIRNFELANKELENTNTELDHFVYSVSHDLSAPLKSISGLVNISRQTEDPLVHQQYINHIEKSVKRLEHFISEIVDYSSNKRREVRYETVLLRDICQEVVNDLQYLDGFQEVKIDFSRIGLTELKIDKLRLKIILKNIINNGIRFRRKITDGESYIKMQSEAGTGFLSLIIEDNGEGIRPEIQHRVFEMFFRGSERSHGSGLGLYIARESAKKIQAEISFQSKYGEGSVFYVRLLGAQFR